jgi:hypothetical protein
MVAHGSLNNFPTEKKWFAYYSDSRQKAGIFVA